MTLGSIVTLTDGTKAGRPHVVVDGPVNGSVRLCYFGSQRWYMPEWHLLSGVIEFLRDDARLRRCKRVLLAVRPDPDGWKRIEVGRYGSTHTVIVGHVDVPWSWQ